MKVELKNLQVAPFMTEETLCFTSDVYIEGEKVGTAKNNGQGEMTHVRIPNPTTRRALAEYVDSLPARNFPKEWGGGEYKLSVDGFIDDIAWAQQTQIRVR